VFACENVNYATGSDNNGGCVCQDNYRWDSVILQCVSKTSNSKVAVGLGVGLGVPLGLLALAGLAALTWFACLPAAAPIAMMPMAAPMAAPIGTTTALVTTKVIPTATTIAPQAVSRGVIGAPIQQIVRPPPMNPGIVSNVRVGSPISNVPGPINVGPISGVQPGVLSPINVGPQLAGPQMLGPQMLRPPVSQGLMNQGIQSVVRRI
jgi:hypothetical protein